MRAARLLWLLLAVISFITFIFGMRAWVQFLFSTPWFVYQTPQLTADGYRQTSVWTQQAMAASLAGLGMSVASFAVIQLALSLLRFFTFTALGIILFVKQPNNRFAYYISLLMMLSGTFYGFGSIFPTVQGFGVFDTLVRFAIAIGIFTLAYLFPDGHFVPRWSKWIVVAWAVIFPLAYLAILFLLQAPRAVIENYVWLELTALVILMAALVALCVGLVAAQIYRYRRVSTPAQRQQSKWFALAFLFFAVEVIAMTALPYFNPALVAPTPTGLAFAILRDVLNTLGWILLPLAIVVAILRYRLWDVDFLINRTLIYVPLTAILAGVFTVASNLTEKTFLAFTTQSNSQAPEAATVLTTLIVVAVFEPLKKRITDFVDKHFQELPDPLKALKAYRSRVEMVLEVMDRQMIARQTLTAIAAAYDATSAALFWGQDDQAKPLYVYGAWNGDSHLRVPLVLDDGTVLGRIELGARRKGREFSEDDRRVLQENLDLVERALVLAHDVHP